MTAERAARAVEPLSDRWFFVQHGPTDEARLNELMRLVDTAAAHGYNGMALSGGLDNLDRAKPSVLENLRKLKAHCDARGVEIIPHLMSAGYGGGILSHDLNLAEGLPVRDALFVAKGGQAVLVPDPAVEIQNGGFEQWKGDRAEGFDFHDQPGKMSFADRSVFKEGQTSLRFESFQNDPQHGHARLMQSVKVHPYRAYRVTLWVKTEAVTGGDFRVQVLTDKRSLAPYDPRVPATTDWREVNVAFNSLDQPEVRVYAGVWGAKSGRFWVDGMRIEEIGPVNVLRRPGTPVRVKGDAGGQAYEEGRDFEKIIDPQLRPHQPYHQPPAIRLVAGGRIQDGERLRVSWYHPVSINNGQVSICMSEPKTYEIWEKSVEIVEKHLAPKKYFLSMDEIRAGGTCEACRARKMSMAEILGDCVTRQYRMIQKANPGALVYIWSDMLDPNHNAHADYYMVEGDYAGSWKFIPKDMIIACWYHKVRAESLKHFSGLGFRTIAAAYYDADDLQTSREWLDALRATPRARGIMYTTWQDKFGLLADFGDMVTKEAAREGKTR
jgi:hypothetical protein